MEQELKKIDNPKIRELKRLRTYILQFIYNNGNGWAFVNAYSVSEAESVFKRQTKYENAKVINIKETKWYGDNIQLVFEGAVTTLPNINLNIESLIDTSKLYTDIVQKIDKAIEEKVEERIDLSKYVTKDEINILVQEAISDLDIDIDLTEYAKTVDVTKLSNLIKQLQRDLSNIQLIPGPKGDKGDKGDSGDTGAKGEPGVGIQDISFENNELTIILTNGTSYNFDIDSVAPAPYIDPNDGIEQPSDASKCAGSFSEALERAEKNPSAMFQWILIQPVDNIQITKIIWHIGNLEFIDAMGYRISEE